jgi:thioredoxin-like negative regulator of GroEL
MELVFVDAEKHPELAAKFNAFSLPVLVLYFEGDEFLRFSKYISISELKKSLDRIYKLYFS